MRALDELAKLKGQFGREAAGCSAALLEKLAHTRLRVPADLIRLHETVLYVRAFPQSPRVARLADEILFHFADRLRGVDPGSFDDPEISGIAGTAVSSNFSFDFARSLSLRHGRAVQIDWENYERPDRMGPVLARQIPLAAEDYAVEPHVNWRDWFEAARLNPVSLLERLDAQTYDLLEIPLRWDLGDSAGSRSRLRLPRRELFYHKGPFLKRSDISIEAELAAPPIPTRRVPTARAQAIAGMIVDASASRYRELYGFLHPDVAHTYHADMGRGVDFFFFGVPKEDRLPLRAYHCGMFFKNGVPMGYFEGMSLFERMEAGFNLYYTFREGETAWLYAQILKIFREHLGVTCFSIDPYQIGHENEEAIASGAFWFYRKLGFRPASEEAARLTAREEAKIASNPAYRTPPAILRRLAAAPLIYGDGKDWDHFSLRRLGLKSHGKVPAVMATTDLALDKQASEESLYLRLLQRRPDLRRTVLRLGSTG